VLQVGAQALGLERNPQCVLEHAAALRGPKREAIRVEGETGLHSLNNSLVFVEQNLFFCHCVSHCFLHGRRTENKTYRAGTALKPGNPRRCRVPVLGGYNRLESVGGNVPKLVVIVAKENHHAVALRVEAARHVLQGFGDDFLDSLLGDWEVLVDRVNGPPGLDEVEESSGGHFVIVDVVVVVVGGGGGEVAGSDVFRGEKQRFGWCVKVSQDWKAAGRRKSSSY